MQGKTHLMVVDDDERLRQLLSAYLTSRGFWVTTAVDIRDLEQKLTWVKPDLMILDIMMPGETGLDYVKRQSQLPPILFLTAVGESEDRVAGLAAGADDYLTKPFEPEELVLRISKILKRNVPQREIRFGPYALRLDTMQLTKDGSPYALTGSEMILLKLLAESAPGALSREQLAERSNLDGTGRSIDVQVARLRRKIEEDPKRPVFIQTVRGEGYALRAGA